MGKRSGMYNRDKRQKELKRKKKQEEKLLRRQKNTATVSEDPGITDSMNIQSESSEEANELTDKNEDTEAETQ